jgi:hypothetical protein
LDGSTMCCSSHSMVAVAVVPQWPPNKEQVGTNCLAAESALQVVAAQAVEVLAADLGAETLHGGISSCPQLHGLQSPPAPQQSVRAEYPQ